MIKGYKVGGVFVMAFLAIITILVVAWEEIALPHSDDFFYMTTYVVENDVIFIAGGERITTIGQALSSFWDHYLLFNCRFTHFFVYLSNLIPYWLYAAICGVLIVSMFVLIVVNVGGRRALSSPILVTGAVLLAWLSLHWEDYMVSKDFQINYVAPSVLVLLFLRQFLRNTAEFTRRKMAWLMILGLVAGWMHEGFSLPVGAGLLWILYSDKRCRRSRYWLFGAFAVGTLLCVGPGTILRIGRMESSYSISHYSYYISRAFVAFVPWLLFLAVLLLAKWRMRSELFRLLVKRTAPWLIIAAVCFLIGCGMLLTGRVFWVMNLSLVVAALIVMKEAFKVGKTVKWVGSSAMALINVAFLVSLCCYQHKVSQEQSQMANALMAGHKELSPVMPIGEQVPWWTLGIPQRIYWYDYSLRTFVNYYAGYSHVVYPVVGCGDKEKRFEQWRKVPGDNPFRGEFPVLYMRDSIPCTLILECGEPTRSTMPFNRLIMAVTGKSSANVNARIVRVESGDSAALYQYIPWDLPRSIQGREVLSVGASPRFVKP